MKMNMPEPAIAYAKKSQRLLAVGGILWWTALALGAVYKIQHHAYWDGTARFWLIMSFVFGALSLPAWWLLYLTMRRYQWDEDGLTLRTPLGETTMRWTEVERFERRLKGGGCVYTLHGPHKRKMHVDMMMYGIESPLHLAIERHASAIRARERRQLDPGAEVSFPERINNGRKSGVSFILGPERITRRTRWRSRSLRYDEVQAVFMEGNPEVGEQCFTRLLLSDGRREWMRIDVSVGDFERLYDCLRQRLASTPWIDMTTASAPDEAAARGHYYRRRIAISREKLKEFRIGMAVATAMIAWLVVQIYLHRHTMEPRNMTGSLVALSLGMIFLLVRHGLDVRRQNVEQRSCIEALGAASRGD